MVRWPTAATTRCLFSVENIDKTHQFQSIYLLLSNIFSIYLHIYLIWPEIIAANSGGTSEQSMPFQENRPFWPMTSTFRSVTKNFTTSKCFCGGWPLVAGFLFVHCIRLGCIDRNFSSFCVQYFTQFKL